MTSSPPSLDELARLEAQLRIENLTLEIAEMKHPWRKPQNVTPVLIALITITYGYWNGWFDAQSKLQQVQKERLGIEIHDFTAQKTTLEQQIATSRNKTRSLAMQLDRLQHEKESSTAANRSLVAANTKKDIELRSTQEQAVKSAIEAAVEKLNGAVTLVFERTRGREPWLTTRVDWPLWRDSRIQQRVKEVTAVLNTTGSLRKDFHQLDDMLKRHRYPIPVTALLLQSAYRATNAPEWKQRSSSTLQSVPSAQTLSRSHSRP